ncbi:MAG: HIT family protein [Gammaproteobacteria bacterium]|nr:HIT family protein [Gammaproteobacteria bacterium]
MQHEIVCRFCEQDLSKRLMIEGELGFAAWDLHPVSEGHFLVIPYRHFDNYFDITDEEREELWSLVARGRSMVEERHRPDGYNIGINVGEAAGQSIHHLHIHVIPRYRGDVENPKGGVRGVIPDKRHYTIKSTDPKKRKK